MILQTYLRIIAVCLGAAQLPHCAASAGMARKLPVAGEQDGAMALGTRNNVPGTFEIPFDTLVYYGELYTFNCSIGTPPQNITIAINMGLGDTIINNSTLQIWANGKFEQKVFYDPKHSQTFHGPSNTITYDNASSDTGCDPDPKNISSKIVIYSQDTLSIGGVTFPDMDFISGGAYKASGEYSDDTYTSYWLGLGPQANVASGWSENDGSGPRNDTILQAFVKQKQIQSNTFSIWLDDPNKVQSGHLLLGGINSKRYQGSLTNLNTSFYLAKTVSELLVRNHTTVSLDSLSITNNDDHGTNNTSTPIVAGAPLHSFAMGYYFHDQSSYFPPAYVAAIADAIGADHYDDNHHDVLIVPCSFLQNSSTLDIALTADSNLTFSVPMSDITTRNGDGPQSDEGSGNNKCVLGILPTPPGLPNYLSKAMLKSLYLLFDLENNIVSGALTNFTSTHNNVIPVPVGGLSAIPNAAFSGNTDSFNSTNSTSATNATLTPNTKSQPAFNDGGVIKTSVGVGIPVIALLVAGIIFCCSRGHKKGFQQLREERAQRHNAQAAARAQAAREFPTYTHRADLEPEEYEVEHDIGLADLGSQPRSYTPLDGYGQGNSGMMDEWRDHQALLGHAVELPAPFVPLKPPKVPL